MPTEPQRRERQMTLWESDGRIVPQYSAQSAEESKRGNARGGKAAKLTRGSVRPSPAHRGSPPVLARLNRITDRAERDRTATFNNLYTLLNVDLLRQAFWQLKRGAAPGVDGQTVEQYEVNLEANLQELDVRLHRQSYRPQPSLRRDIPKGPGKTRPLGIACVEDKLVQRAVVMILERIYEVDFCDTSYGFRPGLSCHDALGALGEIIATRKANWISDADIKGFFDNVSHPQLIELLKHRITDPRMLWLIERFLHAGVMIEGARHDTDSGVPQGSVLSPLLANVYLHYVLDQWFERDVKPHLDGEAHIIRYADDFICAFELEQDAKRFQLVLVKRLARYSLELAVEKTKLLRFGRFASRDSKRFGEGAPGTFDFLGFTHYCGTSRAGKFKLKRKTATNEVSRSQRLVPIEPDQADRRGLAEAVRQAHGTLSVLQRQRQLALGAEIPRSCTAAGHTLVSASQSEFADQLGDLRKLPLSPSVAHSREDSGLDCQSSPSLRYRTVE